MKNIKLTSTLKELSEEMLSIETLYETDTIVLTISDADLLDNSIIYRLSFSNGNELPYEENGKLGKKYFLVEQELYLLVERGDIGFSSVINTYYIAVEKNDGFSIIVNDLSDKPLIDRLTEAYKYNERSISGWIDEGVRIKIPDLKSSEISTLIDVYSNTSFVRLNDNSLNKHAVEYDGYIEGFTSYHAIIIKDDGKLNDELRSKQIRNGDLLYVEPRDYQETFQIQKVKEFAHDIKGDFFAISETLYTYPNDSAAIKKDYPAIYKALCKPEAIYAMDGVLNNAEIVPYIPDNPKLGDEVIYQKISTQFKELSVRSGIFQFLGTKNGDFVISEPAYIRLANRTNIKVCSLIAIGVQMKIITYRLEKFVSYKDEYFGVFRYKEQTKFFTPGNEHECDDKHKGLINGAYYRIYRKIISPIIVTEDEFEKWPVNPLKHVIRVKDDVLKQAIDALDESQRLLSQCDISEIE